MNPAISRAVAVLRRGGVIAYPTEAVWGLGCDPLDEAAVTRLLAIKQRAMQMGLVLIGTDFAQISTFIGLCPESAIARARETWPGPHTWIFPASDRAPKWITGGHAGIALRITAHPVAAALCRGFGGALVSTSANRHGEVPATDAASVQKALDLPDEAMVDGELGGLERPTPIRDAITGDIVRH
ncbi:MAG: Sua5/YciO/YrdC/YwlC family protein [Dokdonella sp.]|uniref:L-threonylcarbamoyladenylate synthase n=1 Tax=Dokdonella sp. TaxID=2291710 RepID=UPI003BAFE499